MTRAEPDGQLELFTLPDAAARQSVAPKHLRLSKQGIRILRRRGPLRVKDLALILGADVGDVWLAVGVARKWGKVQVRDGIVALAAAGEEGTA